MSDSARADFKADVTLSTREREEPLTTRVLVNDDQLVLATEETKTAIALTDVFDIARDVSGATSPDATTTMTLGFHHGESRETASIEAPAKTLGKFQLVLFTVALAGVTVTIKQTGDVTDIVDEVTQASLDIQSSGIRFEWDDQSVSVPWDTIEGFKTSKETFGGQGQQPTVILYTHQQGQAVRTSVSLPSFRYMNLLGRFLQSSPPESFETESESEPSTIAVLLVDDDPADLEMMEVMLKQRDERLQFTTRTSAAGGLKALREDSFDCIVSDYDMPGTDGIEFLQQVRESEPNLPFILFTGQGSEPVAKQALLSDVTDYVEKGIGTQQYEVLLSRIKKTGR